MYSGISLKDLFGSSHIFVVNWFRIKFKTKRCLSFGNEILTVRAQRGMEWNRYVEKE